MGNPNLLPYETIVRATSGEPEAVDEVLRHYSKRIRIAAIENGHIDKTEKKPSIRAQLAQDKEALKNAPKKAAEKTKKQDLERS